MAIPPEKRRMTVKKVWMILVFALGVMTLCEAQEREERRNFQRGRRNNYMRSPEVRALSSSDTKAWQEVQEKVKKADPKGYAEVEKLAASNLGAAFNKFQLMAQKAGVSMPSTRPGRRMMGQGMRNNRMGNRWGGNMRMGRGGRPGMGMMGGSSQRSEAENAIKAKFPQEFAAYEKKQEETRNYIKALAKKAKISLPADFSDLAYIRKKYAAQLKDLDFRQSMEKIRALAEQEGYAVNAPSGGRFGVRGGMDAEASSALPPPPPKRDFSRNMLARKVRERYPAEWKEYLELRRTDRAAADKKLEELLKKVK